MRILGNIGRIGDAAAKRLGRFNRDKSGSSAVEFGFVIGPFVALLFAIMEVALVYSGEFFINNAALKASRLIRIGEAQTANNGGGMSKDDFKAAVCAELPGFMHCIENVIVDVRSFGSFEDAAANLPKPINSNGRLSDTFAQYKPGGPAQVVIVSVYYDWHLFAKLPGLGDFTGKLGLGLGNLPDGSRLISSSVAFRTETYS